MAIQDYFSTVVATIAIVALPFLKAKDKNAESKILANTVEESKKATQRNALLQEYRQTMAHLTTMNLQSKQDPAASWASDFGPIESAEDHANAERDENTRAQLLSRAQRLAAQLEI